VNLISQYGLYLILGTILFVLPTLGILKPDEVVSFLVIFLFILSPLIGLISTQDFFTRVFVAEKRIKEFFEDFQGDEEPLNSFGNSFDFKSLDIKNLSFEYKNESNGFSLDDIDFTIQKGEIVFIVGGNGS